MGAGTRSFSLFLFLLSAVFLGETSAWFQQSELELFDLVEEVNENFYTVMQVTTDANNSDLKKAFRKLSLALHPDKNPAPDASEKFRQMVAIYEVLKDTEKRKRYDQLLREGMPDWRQPVYYFRRVRKMGFGELFVFLSVLLTLGHYLMGWGSYLEQHWALSEARQRRVKKKKGKVKDVDEDLDAEEFDLPRPGWRTLLPLLIVKNLYQFVVSVPSLYEDFKEAKKYQEELIRRKIEEDAAAAVVVVREPRPKKKRVNKIPELQSVPGSENQQQSNQKQTETEPQQSGGLWTDDDLALLAKLLRKYPGSGAGRWEIIAQRMCRTVYEVTLMANKIKKTQPAVGHASLVALQSEASGGHKLLPVNDEESSETDDDDYDGGVQLAEKPVIVEVKKKQKHRPADVAPVSTKPWSQMQQEALEKALQKYAKGVDERWEKIANSVPGKTKEECLERCRELAKNLKKKKGKDDGNAEGEEAKEDEDQA